MRFTDAYAAAPVCSPTRAAILTGLSPARLHLTTHIPDRPERYTPKDAKLLPAKTLDHLPLRYVTIAERLKAAGYRTAFLGKWHLSGHGNGGAGNPEFHPGAQGFDLNIGGCALGGPPTYFDPYRIPTLKNRRKGEYLPDRLADETISFLRANRDRRFLLFLWNYTVHWPMEAPKTLLEKYDRKCGGRPQPGLNDTRYGAMIEAMDADVGRILKVLDNLELAGRTLLVFTSDNGGYSGVADNRPLRKGKGYLYEGGIRIPLIVRWPGVVKAGSTCSAPVISMDFHPTILAAAGLEPDPAAPLDGENLLPLFTQTGGLKRGAIFFHYPNYAWHGDNRLGSTIRKGSYKLIENFDDGSVELYDLSRDLREQHDLAACSPARARELREELHRWRRESGALLPRPRPEK
jgi:arylsulfatase A-like enzyme